MQNKIKSSVKYFFFLLNTMKNKFLVSTKATKLNEDLTVSKFIHVDKAIIHPYRKYEDPRKPAPVHDLPLSGDKLKKSIPVHKPSVPNNLESPFVYMKNLPKNTSYIESNNKEKVMFEFMSAKERKKKIQSLLNKNISMSWAPTLSVSSFRIPPNKKKTKNTVSALTQQDREKFYKENMGLKEFCTDFFDEIEELYNAKSASLHLTNPSLLLLFHEFQKQIGGKHTAKKYTTTNFSKFVLNENIQLKTAGKSTINELVLSQFFEWLGMDISKQEKKIQDFIKLFGETASSSIECKFSYSKLLKTLESMDKKSYSSEEINIYIILKKLFRKKKEDAQKDERNKSEFNIDENTMLKQYPHEALKFFAENKTEDEKNSQQFFEDFLLWFNPSLNVTTEVQNDCHTVIQYLTEEIVGSPLLVSIEAFSYNFHNYIKEKRRIRQITSLKKAKTIANDAKNNATKFNEGYPIYTIIPQKQIHEKVHIDIMRSSMALNDFLSKKKKELLSINLKEFKKISFDNFNEIRPYLQAENYPDDAYFLILDQMQTTVKLIKKRKVLSAFLSRNIGTTADIWDFCGALETMAFSMRQKFENNSVILQGFIAEKNRFQEVEFTFSELTKFIEDERLPAEKNKCIIELLKKIKKIINIESGFDKDALINIHNQFHLETLAASFEMIRKKNEEKIEIITTFIVELEEGIQQYNFSCTQEHVRNVIVANVTAHWIMNHLNQIDNLLNENLIKVEAFNLNFGTFLSKNRITSDDAARYVYDSLSQAYPDYLRSKTIRDCLGFTKKEETNANENGKKIPSVGDVALAEKTDERFYPAKNIANTDHFASPQKSILINSNGDVLNSQAKNAIEPDIDKRSCHKSFANQSVDDAEIDPLSMSQAPFRDTIRDVVNETAGKESKLIKNENIYIKNHTTLAGDFNSKYDMLLPTQYYEHKLNTEIKKDKNEKWYIRPHHIQTITEHQKSLRDNLLDTNFNTYYEKDKEDLLLQIEKLNPIEREEMMKQIDLRLKFVKTGIKPDEDLSLSTQFIKKIDFPTKTKAEDRVEFIDYLESQIQNINQKKSQFIPEYGGSNSIQNKIDEKTLSKYYMSGFEKKDPQPTEMIEQKISSLETIMDELRQQERLILNAKRQEELSKFEGDDQRYQKSNKSFTTNMLKQKNKNSAKNKEYISKLKMKELY